MVRRVLRSWLKKGAGDQAARASRGCAARPGVAPGGARRGRHPLQGAAVGRASPAPAAGRSGLGRPVLAPAPDLSHPTAPGGIWFCRYARSCATPATSGNLAPPSSGPSCWLGTWWVCRRDNLRLDQWGRRESYRLCQTCGLIFSLANREPDARFCCPGHVRHGAQTMTG